MKKSLCIRILSIETSCDETAISILDCNSNSGTITNTVRAQQLFSQADIHSLYGGVFPNIAKREHAARIIPLIVDTLEKSNPGTESKIDASHILEKIQSTKTLLEREPAVFESLREHATKLNQFIQNIDAIVVTTGPGLEPALWVGINTAKALGDVFDIPVFGGHHMEGHMVSPFIEGTLSIQNSENTSEILPALGLMISGGHADIILTNDFIAYEKVGTTKDDAVGEAYDKAARVLGLPYPGGPKISTLAEYGRAQNINSATYHISLPRPMMSDATLNFSFSGLKTAVLYTTRDLDLSQNTSYKKVGEELFKKFSNTSDILTLTEQEKTILAICVEFEQAVCDVLSSKIRKAIISYNPKSLIVGGGVSANAYIKKSLQNTAREEGIAIYMPTQELATDNASMIGLAGFLRIIQKIEKTCPNNDDMHQSLKTISKSEILIADGNSEYR